MKRKMDKERWKGKKLSNLTLSEKKKFAKEVGKVISKGLTGSEDINKLELFIRDVYNKKLSCKDGIGDYDGAGLKAFLITVAKYHGVEGIDEKGLSNLLGVFSLAANNPFSSDEFLWNSTIEDAIKKIGTCDREQLSKSFQIVENTLRGKKNLNDSKQKAENTNKKIKEINKDKYEALINEATDIVKKNNRLTGKYYSIVRKIKERKEKGRLKNKYLEGYLIYSTRHMARLLKKHLPNQL